MAEEMLETLRERLLSVQQDFTSGWVFGGDEKGVGGLGRLRSWVSTRDAASLPSRTPVQSCVPSLLIPTPRRKVTNFPARPGGTK